MISSISSDSSSRTFPLYFACLPTTISITFSLGSLSCHMKHKTDDVIAQNLSILKIRFRHHYEVVWCESVWILIHRSWFESHYSHSPWLCVASRHPDYMISLFPDTSIYHSTLLLCHQEDDDDDVWESEPKIMFHVCEKKCEETLSNLKLGLIVEMSKESELRRISKYPRDMCNTPHCSLVWQKRGCTAYYIEFSVC